MYACNSRNNPLARARLPWRTGICRSQNTALRHSLGWRKGDCLGQFREHQRPETSCFAGVQMLSSGGSWPGPCKQSIYFHQRPWRKIVGTQTWRHVLWGGSAVLSSPGQWYPSGLILECFYRRNPWVDSQCPEPEEPEECLQKLRGPWDKFPARRFPWNFGQRFLQVRGTARECCPTDGVLHPVGSQKVWWWRARTLKVVPLFSPLPLLIMKMLFSFVRFARMPEAPVSKSHAWASCSGVVCLPYWQQSPLFSPWQHLSVLSVAKNMPATWCPWWAGSGRLLAAKEGLPWVAQWRAYAAWPSQCQ